MSLEQDFLHGYEKYSKHFDKWCEKASPILGKVTQCGIVETDNNVEKFSISKVIPNNQKFF